MAAIYPDLPKLARVQLPSETVYALIDADAREWILTGASTGSTYSTSNNYTTGDYVIKDDVLYRCTGATSGNWDATKWEPTEITNEIKDLKESISSGINFRGYTITPLNDQSTTNPIVINGDSYTAVNGDLVIQEPVEWAANTAYPAGSYVKRTVSGVTHMYLVTNAVTAAQNDTWNNFLTNSDAREVYNKPEFLFDGTYWNEVGNLNPEALGSLAYKNYATGTYVRPTGSGTVSVPTITPTKKKLSTTTITGVNGTVDASKVTGGTSKDIAKAGTAVVYGTANVGTAVTYGTANRAASATTVGNANVGTAVVYGTANKASTATTVGNADVDEEVVYGTADVGSSVNVGTALGGTTTFNTNAIKSATLGGTKTFNTDAIKAASLTGTTTFNTDADKITGVEGDMLVFAAATGGTVGISTTPASTGTVTISTSAADTASVTLTTTGITPAVAAPSTQTLTPAKAASTQIYGAVDAPNNQTLTPAAASSTQIYGAETSTSTLTPAVAAPNTQTIVPAVDNGTITGSYTITAVTPAAAAASATTVATGALEDGTQLVADITVSSSDATVTVGTTSATVTVS